MEIFEVVKSCGLAGLELFKRTFAEPEGTAGPQIKGTGLGCTNHITYIGTVNNYSSTEETRE